MTRAREQNRQWETSLKSIGIDVLNLPLIRFSPLKAPAAVDTAGFDWILFTSPQGVRSFFEAGLRPGAAQLGVLGEGTAGVLAACGYRDDLGARVRTGHELATFFCRMVKAPARVLLPGALKRLAQPKADLTQAGFSVTELPLYKTEPVPAAELPENPFKPGDVILFASPSAVTSFVLAYKERLPCAAIGETTAETARGEGFDPFVAENPDLPSLCRAVGLSPTSHVEELVEDD
ncbi:MAG: uroporphyrinogen-III synthase [Candidatus Eisenbacteria bacterium]|uniref:Uroporphyrinogen-III synthase n=1 Tax=Eiseniibacteriota bacterium TaxID=2212470 RepID=A0A948RUZ7_UNCEI|nr:uroporphyrinogen-III synthase [Candidatus Eisenbacteria bacterium]